ncbi:MAG: hypothetical protein ACUZ77_06425 [Candidatus Brocadiales bacterium]
MKKILKIFIFLYLIISILSCVSQAENINEIMDKFYSDLADIIERNMDNPDRCASETDNYYKENQATVEKIHRFLYTPTRISSEEEDVYLEDIFLEEDIYPGENPISRILDHKMEGPFLDYLYRFVSASEEEPFTPKDSTSVVKIKGEYRMSFGYQWAGTDDFYWKYADMGILGNNYRYLWGEKRSNTFNPNVYNSFRLTVDVKPEAQWDAHMDLIVDPWAFVGETERVAITGVWGADIFPILEYWSNTGRTRATTVISTGGNTVNIPEIKVTNGKTEPTYVQGNWGGGQDAYYIPALNIERDFRPVRNLWVDWFNDGFKIKFFPFIEQAHAMRSDDPLGLSDHHIYWEPSPWISYWTRGVEHAAVLGWTSGYWTADSVEGRQGERLRLLRGLSFNGEFDRTTLEGMVASSLSPWDQYERINNISFAGRVKTDITDMLTLGSTYTGRTGLTDYNLESFEQAYGLDSSLELLPGLTFESEVAGSYSGIDVGENHESGTWGEAATGRLHYSGSFDIGETDYKLAYTYMADDFDPPLATYTNTRNDQSWSDHIGFVEYPDDDKKIKVGDGIDRNRNVVSIRNNTSLFEDRFEFLTDYRYSYTANWGQSLEGVFRNEITTRFSDHLTGKTLVISHNNHPGDNREDTWIFGGGLDCKLTDQITVQGIYERANEYPYWPQAAATWLSIDPLPPYPFFNMYKFKLAFEPFQDLVFEYNHCRNGFKYATNSLEDNINYDGVEMRWSFLEKFSAQVAYKHSRVIDLNKQINTGEKDFRRHNNIYGEVNWEISKDKYLKVQYSDLGRFIQRYMVNPDSSADRSIPQPDVLDRQDIIRVTFVGKF